MLYGIGSLPKGISTFRVIIEGDSKAASDGAAGYSSYGTGVSWGRRAAVSFNPKPSYINLAVAGSNLDQMCGTNGEPSTRKDAVLAQITAALDANEIPILIIQMGNGLIQHLPSEYWFVFKPYLAEMRLAGSKIILCDIDHRNSTGVVPPPGGAPGWDIGNGAIVTELNALFRSDPSLSDYIVKFTDYSFGTFESVGTGIGDSSLYLDGIHDTNDCYVLKTPLVIEGIQAVISPDRPENLILPQITGTPSKDSVLTCSTGTWFNLGTIQYQWMRTTASGNDEQIIGATSSTYTPVAYDVDRQLKCIVGCTNAGILVWESSAYTAIITATYGPELFINGGADTDTTGHNVTNATISSVGGRLRLTSIGAFNGRTWQVMTVIPGEWYRYTREYWKDGAGGNMGESFIQDGMGGTTLNITEYPENGTYKTIIQAVGSSLYVETVRDHFVANPGLYFEIDNASLKRIL